MHQKKNCILVLLLVFQAAISNAQTYEAQGEVMGLWNVDTIQVTGDIFLPSGASLLIEAGVVVQFQGYFGFRVDGSLQALGQADEPIIFSVNDTTGNHNMYLPDGGWRGIFLIAQNEDDNISASFEYCHFEYAKTWEGDTIPQGGAVYISGPVSATFRHCTFSYNRSFLSGAAIYFNGASPLIENCHFIGNKAGHLPVQENVYGYGGGICGLNTKSIIRGSIFFDNWSSGLGGGLSIDTGDPVIENNIFEGNDSPLGGGFGILRSQVLATIANNLVLNNTSMFFGGGIALITTRANLANNTIINNYATYGGGLYFNFESFVKVYNTILWGNSSGGDYGGSVFIWDGISIPDFYNCNIEGGLEGFDGASFLGEYLDNIDEDPQFKAEGEYPWQLQQHSPCINAGIEDHEFLALPTYDLAGNPRVQLGRIDMGAYESDTDPFTNISGFFPLEKQLMISPNPVKESAKSSFFNQKTQHVRISVINTHGQEVISIFDGILEAGCHEFTINIAKSQAGKGVYFLVAQWSGGKIAERLVIIR